MRPEQHSKPLTKVNVKPATGEKLRELAREGRRTLTATIELAVDALARQGMRSDVSMPKGSNSRRGKRTAA